MWRDFNGGAQGDCELTPWQIYNAETGRNIASGLHTTMTPAARKRAADAAIAAEKAKAKL